MPFVGPGFVVPGCQYWHMCSNGSLSSGAAPSTPGEVPLPGRSLPSGGGLAALAAAIDGLNAEDVSGLPVGVLAEDLVALNRQLARLQGEAARRVAVLDTKSGGLIEGHVSTASWLRSACSLSASQASGLVRTARVLRDRPASAAMLAAGRISYPHVQVIAAALADLPADTHGRAELILLEAAEKLDPGRLRAVAARLRETINRDHAERSEQRDHARRRPVLGADSEILDVGRTQRLVTPAQREALTARDQGCTWSGCHRPPWWTDAHHITPWTDGGPTDLANLILLCRTHHKWTHQGKRMPTRRTHRGSKPGTPATRAGPAP